VSVRLLLDTHVVLWWLLGDERVPVSIRGAVADVEVETFVSAATAWEVAIKHNQGKLPAAAPLVADFEGLMLDRGFTPLSITFSHSTAAGMLPLHHRDPFDRVLIAQALAEGMTLVSDERLFDRYGVARLW
jgi:PIN domain nuclease of toxin-antitoxin system